MKQSISPSQHHYPFGMLTPGRNWSAGSEYRFGFNGKESDAETYGEGNIYDFGARIYDARLGKFFSVDPKYMVYPYYSPFCFAGNNPVLLIDENGEGPIDPRTWKRVSTTLLFWKKTTWLNIYEKSNSRYAYDKTLYKYGYLKMNNKSSSEKLVDEFNHNEWLKIKEGSEFITRNETESPLYRQMHYEKNGNSMQSAAISGNYDYSIQGKNKFSIYEVNDGIITSITNYKKNKSNEYEITGKTLFQIEIEEIKEGDNFMGHSLEMTYDKINVTEINYNKNNVEKGKKKYSHKALKTTLEVKIDIKK